MPRPIGAELWIGAMSDAGVKRAARFGCPWPTDPLHNIDVMKHWAGVYRATGEEHGTSQKLRVNLLRDGWVADSMEEVERVWWPAIRAEHWFYFENIPRWVAEFEPFLADVKSEDDFKFENHLKDRLIVGTPEDCIAADQGVPGRSRHGLPDHDVPPHASARASRRSSSASAGSGGM